MKSDDEVRRDVESELSWEPSIDARDIGVAVKDGIATLTGHVHSYWNKLTAERAAKRVAGVKGIADDIEVTLPMGGERTDTDIAESAVTALRWNYQVPRDHVRPVVHDGWITLEGEVNWHYQRLAAMQAVEYLLGVKGVTNDITVKKPIASSDTIVVKTTIEQAFQRNALLDVSRISVQTHDGTVTLRGSVRSWAEHDEAERAAYTVSGVYFVENDLAVAY